MMRFGFSQLDLLGSNITDVVPVARTPDSVSGMLLANNTDDRVERLDPDLGNPYGGFVLTTPVLDTELAAIAGNIVSVYSPAEAGPFLGLVDSPAVGTPGSLFWVDPQNTAGLAVVGAVGEGPRRVRCLQPAGTPCAITNYTTGSVMVADWPDRASPPTVRPTSVAVAGPVGVDLALVGGTPTAVATGFADSSVHLITIPVSGDPIDQAVTLTGCANPGHAIFTPGGTHIVSAPGLAFISWIKARRVQMLLFGWVSQRPSPGLLSAPSAVVFIWFSLEATNGKNISPAPGSSFGPADNAERERPPEKTTTTSPRLKKLPNN
jgi:hypothetical protein